MPEYKSVTRSRKRYEDDEAVEATTDQRDAELDNDVSCCLAEIDDVLADQPQESEAERRERERGEALADYANGITGEQWEQKWAHLGARVVNSCCVDHPTFQ